MVAASWSIITISYALFHSWGLRSFIWLHYTTRITKKYSKKNKNKTVTEYIIDQKWLLFNIRFDFLYSTPDDSPFLALHCISTAGESKSWLAHNGWKKLPFVPVTARALPVGASRLILTTAAGPGISQQPLWLERKRITSWQVWCGEPQLLPFRWLATSKRKERKIKLEKEKMYHRSVYMCMCAVYFNHLSRSQKASTCPIFSPDVEEGKESLERVLQSK